MLEATGAAKQLGVTFVRRDSFDGHPDVLAESLVKCASMTDDGGSTDWHPGAYKLAYNCVVHRFVPNVLNPRYARLKTILILGSKGWNDINTIEVPTGRTVHEVPVSAGKRVLWFPHPSGENGEYVALAKRRNFPTKEAFVNEQYKKYVATRRESGKPMKKSEPQYKQKAGIVWARVDKLRKEFAT